MSFWLVFVGYLFSVLLWIVCLCWVILILFGCTCCNALWVGCDLSVIYLCWIVWVLIGCLVWLDAWRFGGFAISCLFVFAWLFVMIWLLFVLIGLICCLVVDYVWFIWLLAGRWVSCVYLLFGEFVVCLHVYCFCIGMLVDNL